MLRQIIGDEAFFVSINEYLEQYGYNVSNTDAIKAIFQKNVPRNLDNFFSQWVERESVPRYQISADKYELTGNIRKYFVKFSQLETKAYGTFVGYYISVRLFGSGKFIDTTLWVDSTTFDAEIETDFDITNIFFNPINQLPALGYLSNLDITSVRNIDKNSNITNFYPNPS